MASPVAVPNDFTVGTPAVADNVDANFAAIVSYINTNMPHLDGSKSFTGAVGVGTATTASHAVTKAQLDAAAGPSGAWSSSALSIRGAVSDPSLGGSGLVSTVRWVQRSKSIEALVYLTLGAGATSGNGAWLIHLPVNARATEGFNFVGHGYTYDATDGMSRPVVAVTNGTDGSEVQLSYTSFPGVVNQNGPGSGSGGWAAGDQIRLILSYEAA